MKKILVLSFFLSLSAFAADESAAKPFNFTFFGNTAGRYTMVSCDYATPVVQAWMEKFGAKKIDVSCTGGIQPYGISPLNLRVTYTAADLSGPTQGVPMTLESGPFPGDSNCDFDTSLMRSLLAEFKNVTVERRSDACFNGDSRYNYDVNVELPQTYSLPRQ